MERKIDRVDIATLREMVNRTLDFVEKDLGRSSVELKENFYWSISDDVLYAMDKQPAELDCGSLFDDWEFVEKAAKHKDQALPLMFLHVAPLLRAMATMVPSYTPPSDKTPKE